MRYTTHYTREEARALLPQIRTWLKGLDSCRESLTKQDAKLATLRTEAGDLGGKLVNRWARTLAEARGFLLEFSNREIEIKDLSRGLIDFPAIIDGKEVYLCWENGEDDIEFWHDLEAGYAGRTPIEEE